MARRKNYPGSIRRRRTGWQVRLCVDGVYHNYGPGDTEALRGCTRREAENFARAKHDELTKKAGRRAEGLPVDVRFSTLLEKYEADRLPLKAKNTRATYADSLAAFREYFVEQLGDPLVAKVRPGHVHDFLNWRRLRPRNGSDAPLSNRTLQKDRAVLHAVFALAEELEYREGNPVAGVRAPKADKRTPIILTPDDFEALLAACDRDGHRRVLPEGPMLKLYLLLLHETGARCDSEALWIRWEDLDFDAGAIFVDSGRNGRRTKAGKARWLPMSGQLRKALQEHVLRYRAAEYDGATSPWIFHHVYSRRRAKAGQRVASFRRGFQAAVKRAKLPAELHQHDLRHGFVTRALAEGIHPVAVQKAAGHADLRTTMGYEHLTTEYLEAFRQRDRAGEEQAEAAVS